MYALHGVVINYSQDRYIYILGYICVCVRERERKRKRAKERENTCV